jgi:hypothetical protein
MKNIIKLNHMIFLIDAKKALEKHSILFLNKNSKQTRTRKIPQAHMEYLQKFWSGLVAHACNLSYLGGRDQSSRPAQENRKTSS